MHHSSDDMYWRGGETVYETTNQGVAATRVTRSRSAGAVPAHAAACPRRWPDRPATSGQRFGGTFDPRRPTPEWTAAETGQATTPTR